MTLTTSPVSATSPQATPIHSLLEQLRELEAAPHPWRRENVEKRIQLYNAAIRNSLSLPDSSSNIIDGGQKCKAVLPGIGTEYELEVDFHQLHQLPFPPAAQALLRQPELIIELNTSAHPALLPDDASSTRSILHDDSSNAQSLWLGLVFTLLCHYQHTQEIQDLKALLLCATYALTLSTEKVDVALVHVGFALRVRYEVLADLNDYQSALTILQYTHELCVQENRDIARSSYELGRAYISRYDRSGDVTLLNSSIPLLHQSLESTPAEDFFRSNVALTLAVSYRSRYRLYEKTEDAAEELRLMEDAVNTCPLGHPYRVPVLQGLGVSFDLLYKRSGNPKHINKALELHNEALSICPPSHRIYPRLLNGLGIQLFDRYQRDGRRADLDAAIDAGQRILSVLPDDLPPLVNLSEWLGSRFWLTGNLNDLVESIRLMRRSVKLCPPGFPYRDLIISNLGAGLITRFEHTFEFADLQEATVLLREAASFWAPDNSEGVDARFSLAHALKLRYQNMDTVQDLEEACEMHFSWFESRTDKGHLPGYFRLLYDVANLRRIRYERFGHLEDLQLAIECQEESVHVQPTGNPETDSMLDELAACYRLRAELLSSAEDAQKALNAQKEALELVPVGHSRRSHILLGLTRLYLLPMLAEQSFETAIDMFIQAIKHEYSSAQSRISEGLEMIQLLQSFIRDNCLEETHLRTLLLDAYRSMVNLLPQVAYFGLDVQARFHALSQAPTLAADAAAHALAIKETSAALELLEEGRAVFWLQFLRLRSSFQHLPPALADELSEVAHRLELGAGQIGSPSRSDQDAMLLHEARSADRRQLSEKFEALLSQARSLPGLQRFMLSDTVSTLTMAAIKSPVVVLVATSDYCGALLLRDPHSPIEEIKLGAIVNIKSLEMLSQIMRNTRQSARRPLPVRAIVKTNLKHSSSSGPLDTIWCQVMEKIVQTLGLKKAVGRHRPRLFLCATGQFSHIPLHAACSQTEGCWDYFVPSYTPTLSVLVAAQKAFIPVRRSHARTLLAAVPVPFKWTVLPQTVSEIKLLKTIIPAGLVTSVPSTPSLTAGRGGSATSEDVTRNLSNAAILHLACHGHHNPENPLESGFVMGNGMLTVTELMKLNLPHAFMAFLSACETAKAAADQPDQAVHLAATMLFSGFKSVVGTMWSMGDVDGPVVASRVYEELFKGDDELLDPDSVPYALDAALAELRSQRVHPSRWAPYVHFGI